MHDQLPVFANQADENGDEGIWNVIKVLQRRGTIRIIYRHNVVVFVNFYLSWKQLNPEQAENKDNNEKQYKESEYIFDGLPNLYHHLVESPPLPEES